MERLDQVISVVFVVCLAIGTLGVLGVIPMGMGLSIGFMLFSFMLFMLYALYRGESIAAEEGGSRLKRRIRRALVGV